ncbi:F-box protein At5g07610 isoform X1 [Juglans microcarpa x Juglans regia]|uniref:F-box protein At5g07610 isoform X1 n=1 Tax=Juglans microcarpa x Juglans regia TaxID=2249226 RepID=UPI001B7E20D7|nr:F-box protein At5g07610 isoform X1 [Juglans microcarpa x Juglans regia]
MPSTAGNKSPNNTTAAAEMIGGNDDIVTEILLRLPVKPLFRFKCVSKRWLSLISGPHFSRCYHHPRVSVSGIFLRRRIPSHFQFVTLDGTHSKPPFTSLDFITDNDNDSDPPCSSRIKILQSCNGLLLCRSLNKTLTDQSHRYYVCNPTTKQFSKLPFISTERPITIFGLSLAFEPTKSPYYQVVCVWSAAVSVYFYQIRIYSSETRAWRPCGSPFVVPFDMVFDHGVFWNGAVHWLSPSGAAMFFNLDKEILGTMPSLPGSEAWGKRRFRYFGESGGHLHLIEIYGARTTQFQVFEMASDYSGWFVKDEVDLDGIVAAYPEMVRNFLDPCDSCYVAFVIVFVVRNEEEEAELLLHVPGKILSYNLREKSFNKCCELTPYSNESSSSLQFGWLDAYQYMESLACV